MPHRLLSLTAVAILVAACGTGQPTQSPPAFSPDVATLAPTPSAAPTTAPTTGAIATPAATNRLTSSPLRSGL